MLEPCEQAGHVALPGIGGGSAPLRRRESMPEDLQKGTLALEQAAQKYG